MANVPAAAPPVPATPPCTEGPRLEVEALLTTHRVFEAFDGQKKGLEWLHRDLFDSRLPVALSALQVVGVRADARSFPLAARLLGSAQEEMQCAAARALGKIPHPGVAKLLMGLVKTTRSEKLRRELLEAMASAAPRERETVGLIRQIARSPLASASTRGHAAGLLLKIGGEIAFGELLVDARDEVLEQILRTAAENPPLIARTVAYAAGMFPRLPARSRAALVDLAARGSLPESAAVMKAGLADQHPEVRRAAYLALGTSPFHAGLVSEVLLQLSGSAEENPALEDEVQQAIARMEGLPEVASSVSGEARLKVSARVVELYKQLAAAGRHVSDDTHELGWLIQRSKEYLEYYGDDEFKSALVRWLKGASTDTEGSLLKMLKATAVRVEVRHFDGYSALSDLIKNPKRPGMALVQRELAMTRTGKSRLFWHLVRVVRLCTLFLSPAPHGAEAAMMRTLFAWAKQEKLFRLAEASLVAMAKVDPPHAQAACTECLQLPLASKVLAIASLHLLRDLAPDTLEPAATRLLSSQDDPYVTMNAIEAISVGPASSSADLAKALLARLSLSANREVRESVAGYLGGKVALDILESLKEPALSGDETLRAAALSIMDRRITGGLVGNRDGTVEFLYRILRGEHEPSRRAAAVMLWKLGDDYAPEVLRDFLGSGSEPSAIEVLRLLRGSIAEQLLPALAPLLTKPSATLHAALRDVLLQSEDVGLREKLVALALQMRGGVADEDDGLAAQEESVGVASLGTERASFQFEREHIQELVVFFSDIVGYSKKAQVLTPMQLSTLIQDYEKILLSHTESHGGQLIKRMGDGHMIVFERPLDATLAAIRLQKALRRFNRYRDETTRVVIRIGIHAGPVVRKDKDILGNNVNIASRLESSAQPGSILISDQVHEKVKEAVHAREIGHITVKNISEPIKVFEPYEIVLDLPPEKDPLRQAGRAARAAAPQPAAAARDAPAPRNGERHSPGEISLDRQAFAEVVKLFASLDALCRKAQDGRLTVSSVAEQVLGPWDRLKPRLPASGPAREVRAPGAAAQIRLSSPGAAT